MWNETKMIEAFQLRRPLLLATVAIIILLIIVSIETGYILSFGRSTTTVTTTQTDTVTTTTTTTTTSSTSTTSTIWSPNKTNPFVGAFYYLWYGFNYSSKQWTGGLGTSHWNDSKSGIVKDEPTIGYYSSMSNTTLAYQIPLMLEAGINFVMISWWGWGNDSMHKGGSPNTLNEAVNNATLNLLRWIEANNSPMKVSIMVDAFNSTDFGETQYAQIRNYVENTFYIPFANEIQCWQGKPLIGWFNPLDPTVQNSSFTDRVIGNNPYVNWTFWSGDTQFLQATNRPASGYGAYSQYIVGPVISSDGEVGVIPKYDDYYLSLDGSRPLYMRFDINYSLGMYGYDWNQVVGSELRIGLVMIYSWNEYHEMSEIEPHSTFSNPNSNSTSLLQDTEYWVSRTNHPFDASQEIRAACDYLSSNYDSSRGLIAETQNHSRYFLYSDNFLASLVLSKDCNNSNLAAKVNEYLSLYDASKYPNQFMVLNSSAWNFNSSKDFNVADSILTTVNNQTGTLSPNGYADIAFLQAYYYFMWGHNFTQALNLFQIGAQLYNGTGFFDKPFQVGNSGGIFQTYKLALYMYVAGILGQSVPVSVLVNLLKMQAPSGGFYTGYTEIHSNNSTNTETTCLAIMALEVL